MTHANACSAPSLMPRIAAAIVAAASALVVMPSDSAADTKALAALSRSFVELEYLPKEPDMATLYTEEFLPKP
jgi:hypothetical protein